MLSRLSSKFPQDSKTPTTDARGLISSQPVVETVGRAGGRFHGRFGVWEKGGGDVEHLLRNGKKYRWRLLCARARARPRARIAKSAAEIQILLLEKGRKKYGDP